MTEIAAASNLLLNVHEMQLNRWYYERERLVLFPSFALLGISSLITAAEGTLDTQYGNTYGIRIDLSNYPHALPRVVPKGWIVHPEVTHKFSDGAICGLTSGANTSRLLSSWQRLQFGSTSTRFGSGTVTRG
jgi:hypothetical protein